MGTTISSRCHRRVLCAVASSGLDSDLRFSDGMRPESEVRNRLPLEEAEFKPSVPLARVSLDSRGGEGAGGRSDRLERRRPFHGGPVVRIRLPPVESQLRTGLSGAHPIDDRRANAAPASSNEAVEFGIVALDAYANAARQSIPEPLHAGRSMPR